MCGQEAKLASRHINNDNANEPEATTRRANSEASEADSCKNMHVSNNKAPPQWTHLLDAAHTTQSVVPVHRQPRGQRNLRVAAVLSVRLQHLAANRDVVGIKGPELQWLQLRLIVTA